MSNKVITFGTFDTFHEGHYNILKRAKELGDYLVVGISSDTLSEKKGKETVWKLRERLETVKNCDFVDEVFVEESLEQKLEYVKKYGAKILVMGDDWENAFDWVGITCVYFPRTPVISTTLTKIHDCLKQRTYTFLFYDMESVKHVEYYNILVKCFNKIGIKHFELIRDYKYLKTNPNVIDTIDAIIQFNNKELIEDYDFHQKIKNKPVILIDHGAATTKWFLMDLSRYQNIDYFLVAGPAHKKSMEFFFGKNDRIISTGFIKSEFLFQDSIISKQKFVEKYNLDPQKKIIIYAPTWFLEHHSAVIKEHRIVYEQLEKIGNYVVCLHPCCTRAARAAIDFMTKKKIITNENTSEIMKLCDIVISDNSSIIIEALSIKKKTIQILMPLYVDNPATNYVYPLSAGTCNYFICGIPTKSDKLYDLVVSLDDIPAEIYDTIRFNIKKGTYIYPDAYEKIVFNLLGICNKPFNKEKKIQQTLKCSDISENCGYINKLYIAHAGGTINNFKYTNSKEAIQYSIDCGYSYIEVDIVKLLDNYALAHDSHEKHYGLEKKFGEITGNEFKQLKSQKKFTTLLLSDIFAILLKYKNLSFILDIKETTINEYKKVITYIVNGSASGDKDGDKEGKGGTSELLNRIIPQIYSLEEYQYLESINYPKCLCALWKKHDANPFHKKVFNNLIYMTYGKVELIGISLRHINPSTGENNLESKYLYALQSYGKIVYIHDIRKVNGVKITNDEIIMKSCGIYADYCDIVKTPEFGQIVLKYIIFKVLLKRIPEKKIIYELIKNKRLYEPFFESEQAVRQSDERKALLRVFPSDYDISYFLKFLENQETYSATKKNNVICIDIKDIHGLIKYMTELKRLCIQPTELFFIDYKLFILDYKCGATNIELRKMYGKMKREFLIWTYFKWKYMCHGYDSFNDNIKKLYKFAYSNGLVGDGNYKYETENFVTELLSDKYLDRFNNTNREITDIWNDTHKIHFYDDYCVCSEYVDF